MKNLTGKKLKKTVDEVRATIRRQSADGDNE